MEWRKERLEALAKAVGGRPALAKLMGHANDSYIGQMIRGGRPITEKTVNLAEDVTGKFGWFLVGREDGAGKSNRYAAPAEAASSGDIQIPEFDTGGAMGHGLVLQDQPGVIKKWVVSPDWVQQNVHRITSAKNLVIVTGFGDSMKPLYNPGDPLLVDRGITRADVDGVYFFRVGDEGFVKRLQRIPTVDGVLIRAKSENTKYDPFDIVKGMDFEVFGRVVKAWRGEEF